MQRFMVDGQLFPLIPLMGLAVGFFIIIYIYLALAFMTIAKKLKYKYPWLAWIPVANLFLFSILAKKHWAWGFIFLVPVVNVIFMIIWTWAIYERRKYPGWLALVPLAGLIPSIGAIANIAHLVIIGFVAWKDR